MIPFVIFGGAALLYFLFKDKKGAGSGSSDSPSSSPGSSGGSSSSSSSYADGDYRPATDSSDGTNNSYQNQGLGEGLLDNSGAACAQDYFDSIGPAEAYVTSWSTAYEDSGCSGDQEEFRQAWISLAGQY